MTTSSTLSCESDVTDCDYPVTASQMRNYVRLIEGLRV